MKTRKRIFNPTVDKETSRVKQEFVKEVNINTIMGRAKQGQVPPAWMRSTTPRYGDFTDQPQTLMEAFDVVQKAQEAFLSLPVAFRRELDHNPMNLDKAPRELYEKYGLLKETPVNERSGTPDASSAGVARGVRGDSDLPARRQPGANKGGVKSPPADSEGSDEA